MAADINGEYAALRIAVGAVWLARDAIRVAGPDALAFLDGQLSQDINAIAVGGAAESLLLQPQGKVVALVRVMRDAVDAFVIDTDAGFADAVIERLERFKLRTKATIERVPEWQCLGLRGPRAHDVAVGIDTDWPGFPGVDLVGATVVVPADVPMCGAAAYEAARIEAGVPMMGRELTEDTIPAEATGVVERAVSFTKGCYTGQELVARIDSRGGNVPRHLCGVELSGTEPPVPGAPLLDAAGTTVGTVTSSTWSPRTSAAVALAYIPRKIVVPAEIVGGVVKALPLA